MGITLWVLMVTSSAIDKKLENKLRNLQKNLENELEIYKNELPALQAGSVYQGNW